MMIRKDSPITLAYERILERSGSKRAKIAAARHLLRAICYMLKRKQTYDEYIMQRRGVKLNLLHTA